ncbi:MAG: hypothetical protein ACYC6G_02290 [Desulfobaccales bacterium]
MEEIKFNEIMEQIDGELRLKGTPIHGRSIAAMCELSGRLKITIPLFPQALGAIEGVYNELTFAAHIDEWYKLRYCDRLKVYFGPGSVALLIRGDPWRMKLPRFFGIVKVTCDPDLVKHINSPNVCFNNDSPIYNILNCVENLPQGLAYILTHEELKQILNFFITSMHAYHQLEVVKNREYIKEATADLDASVAFMFASPPQYGLSKWSSLQFIEKLIKSFLSLRKAKIPRTHDLAKIANEAENIGLNPVNYGLLAKIQCTAGVRYGEPAITLKEAMTAHHAALVLSKQLTQKTE